MFFASDITFEHVLDNDQREKCEGAMTLSRSMCNMKNNKFKSPRLDGMPSHFAVMSLKFKNGIREQIEN